MTSDDANTPRVLEIVNERGLHARASAKFVKVAEQYDAEVQVTKGCYTVGGTSIMGLMMLAASKGCHIDVTATGAESEKALDAIAELVANRFDEEV